MMKIGESRAYEGKSKQLELLYLIRRQGEHEDISEQWLNSLPRKLEEIWEGRK